MSIKKAPTPPPAPDPSQVINASANANNQSAVNQATLNNVNYSGPQGTVTYNRDPNTNQFTENVLLNPTNQATESAYQADQELGANIAGEGLNAVRGAIGHPLNQPSLQTGVNAGGIQSGYDAGGPIQKSIQNTSVQTGIGPTGPIQSGIHNPGAIQGQVAPTYSPFGTLGLGGGAPAVPQASHMGAPPGVDYQSPPGGQGGQSAQASAPSGWDPNQKVNGLTAAQEMDPNVTNSLASRVAIAQTPGHANYLAAIQKAGGADAYEKRQLQAMGYNSAPAPQGGGGGPSGGQAQPPLAQGGGGGATGGQYNNDPYAAIASNPVASTQLATYAQARQMLDPQWQQATEQQQAQLAAQGLSPNSAAYQNSMQLFGNQQNQAYNSAMFGAINAGDQEQNALYGQNLASAQYGLGAQNQNYNQLMGQAGLGNSAQLQDYTEQMGKAGLYNSASGQQFGQNLAQGQYGLAAQGQQNAQNAAAAGFHNTAENQDFQQQMSNAQLNNQTAQQQFQNQAYAQQMPINDFNALMSSSQVGMPPSAPAQNTSVAPTDVTGAYGLNAQVNQANYAAKMQNYQSGLGGLFNLGSAGISALGMMSDVRLKRDIVKIGERPDGIGVYVFRYKAHNAQHVGVMAQEVAKIRPDCVFVQDGWLGVDYGRLAA